MGKKLFAAVLRVKVLKAMTGKNSVRSTCDHNSRAKGDFRHTDESRASQNMILYGTQNPFQDVKNIVEQHGLARKDSPPANEIIVTAASEHFINKSHDEILSWANDNTDFFLKEFDGKGKGKIAHIVLHLDEAAPHLHILMVPVCEFTIKNRHGEKTVQKVNHAGVLGKPRGGYPKGTPPSETRLGLLHTAYAEAMAKHGLIRGQRDRRLPDGSKLQNTSPYIYRQEMYAQAKTKLEEIQKLPDGELVSRKEALALGAKYFTARGQFIEEENKKLSNRIGAMEQFIAETAQALGCKNPAVLSRYADDIRIGLEQYNQTPQRFAQKGRKIRQQKEEASQSQVKEQAQRSRKIAGQRATKEERRAARAARKLLGQVPSINDTSTITSVGGYHHESRIIYQHPGQNPQQHRQATTVD